MAMLFAFAHHLAPPLFRGLAVAACAAVLALPALAAPAGAKGPAQHGTKADARSASAEEPDKRNHGGGERIVALVNDEIITARDIEMRARFLAVSSNIGSRAQEVFKSLVKQDSTNQRLRAILEATIKANPGKSREQITAIFEVKKKEFAQALQKQAIDSARAGMVPKFREQAYQELIDERLKVQEAKRLGFEVADEEVNRVIKDIAERNKMTVDQFGKNMAGMGTSLTTMKSRFRAQIAWREVIRRRFSAQISVNQRDIDRLVAASDGGVEEGVELQLQKITLPLPSKIDQAALAHRFSEAEALRRKFGGCKGMAGLANGVAGAKFDDMKFQKPGVVSEPTRSMLVAAKDGEMLPPQTTASGVELYAVCSRRVARADDAARQKAQEELQTKEYERRAEGYLRDLRQDAHIEKR